MGGALEGGWMEGGSLGGEEGEGEKTRLVEYHYSDKKMKINNVL